MPTLSSSIVKHHVATMREVEEALARQVVYGGDLVTNLLELAQVSEAQLTWLLADSLGLEPAPIGELPSGPESMLRLVPPELAQRHGIYPMAESAGTLELAVSDRLSPEVEDDLSFRLGLRIVQRAAPLVRIHQALARDHGVPLDRRMLRLVARLEGRPDPSPSSFPAPLREGAAGFPRLPRPASMPPVGYPAGAQDESRPSPPVREEASRDAAPPAEEQPAGRAPAVTLITPRDEQPAGRAPAVTLITPRHPAEKTAPPSAPPPRWLEADKPRERGRRRQRGPYTAAMAEHDLLEAGTRDDVVATFFDFASQYFEYSALFAVQGDLAEGRDAHGPGTDRESIRAIGFPLDLPSALSRAKNAGTFQLALLEGDGLDANLAKDLGRRPGRTVLILPVVVRGRCVLLLYGDHGDADVALADIGDLIAFAPLAASAIERVILRKKLSRQVAAAGEPAKIPIPAAEMRRRQRHALPAIEQRVHALASALDVGERSPSRPPSAPPAAAPSSPAPATVAASPGALAGPSTAHESPMAKVGPTTLEETPQAKRPSGEQRAVPGPTETPEPTLGVQPPEQLTEDEIEPATTAGSPQALAAIAESRAPETPEETPLARARALEPPPRRNTPPQGTPGALPPAVPQPEDQPFPLTRRAPSSRAPSAGPSSGEMLAAVDGAWDSVRDSATQPGVGPTPNLGEPQSDVGHEAPLAPASRQLALGPRPPFRRQDAKDRLLPSVIVDVNADSRLLVEQLVAGDEESLDAVIRVGDAAVSHLVAAFPGPLHPDRRRSFAEPGARASDAGLVLRALARIGTVAIPFVVVRTADRDPTVRAWATWLLGELPSAESARAVVRRFSDADSNVRRAALAAGRMLQSDVEARTALRDSLATMAAERGQAAETRHDAIQALADLRDGRAVPRLIPLLDNENAALQRSAHWALVTLARQDFGYDSTAWTQWWEAAGSGHRIEWLIDALVHEKIDIRRAAGEELKAQTKEYFGYYEDLSAKERERAQQAYREWWQRVGKARFP